MCNSTDNIYKIQIEGSLLGNGTTLPLFLTQSPLSEKTEIASCQTNGNVRRFIDSLFSGGANSHIAQMAFLPDAKAVVLLPESSLSKDFWHDMDNLISQSPGSLIIIAGIGLWTEKELLDWKDVSGNRGFGFHISNQFGSPYRKYNCGCSWIRKENGDMRSIIFLKNFQEPRHEASSFPSEVEGTCLLCLSFDDIDIYPLICADITCNSTGLKPLDRVLNNIKENNNHGKKHLIATIAFQEEPGHPLWQRGIAHAVKKQGNSEPVILAIANTSTCRVPYKCVDGWRNLTGVYVATDLLKEQDEYPAACCLCGDREIFGVLARTGEAAVFAGEIAWDFGGGGRRYIWRPRLRALANDDGTLMPPEEGDRYRDELIHCLYVYYQKFLPKETSDQNPEIEIEEIVNENKRLALEEIIGIIKDPALPTAKQLYRSMLFGPNHANKNQGTLDKQKVKDKIQQASKALGALKKATNLEWQPDNELDGQLKHPEANILVWASPNKMNRAIERELEKWKVQATPRAPLLVFADGMGGTFKGLSEIKPDRRTDISSSPPSPPTEKDYTCNKIVRVAHLEDLRCFDDCYEEQNFDNSVRTLLDQNLAKIRGS